MMSVAAALAGQVLILIAGVDAASPPSAEAILKRKPDGVFLSNGPGDPSAAPYAVETVKGLIGKVPIFGVCMGHQILAQALGGKTFIWALQYNTGDRGRQHSCKARRWFRFQRAASNRSTCQPR